MANEDVEVINEEDKTIIKYQGRVVVEIPRPLVFRKNLDPKPWPPDSHDPRDPLNVFWQKQMLGLPLAQIFGLVQIYFKDEWAMLTQEHKEAPSRRGPKPHPDRWIKVRNWLAVKGITRQIDFCEAENIDPKTLRRWIKEFEEEGII